MTQRLARPDEESNLQQSAFIAVFCISTLNIAIQPLQGGLRALIVDTVPRHQQQTANAWAGVATSTTNLLCYLLSSLDLSKTLNFLGNSQFSILCVVTSLFLAMTITITCVVVKENNESTEQKTPKAANIIITLRYLCGSFPRLSPVVQGVLKVQFFSWMGWFPFLYYITIFVDNFTTSDTQHGTMRSGSVGLIIFSLASLLAGTTFPSLMTQARRASYKRKSSQGWYASPRHVWIASHILFASCMLATVLATSLWELYFLVGINGISWGITIWAPHAMISSHLSEKIVDQFADDGYERRPGIVVGLHNAAIAAPQIVAAIGCSLLFWMFDGASGDSVGWVIRVSALPTLTAAWLAKNVPD
ncbi:General alpha-glucoside permease-like protein [Cladobotryum mycophilum]|uniref:General alpha-glucoside permease-like protein n=1 Tax=Cladobotryum mycophilum TaxID=491253 RepID=A0ABR0SIG5_9HYPO